MEKWRNIVAALMIFTALVIGCKEHNDRGQDVGAGNQDGENYVDEQDKSDVTEKGQHIGATSDSTSMDGEPGNRSNY